jgi:ABC-type nitrate/sulfonate/bicarbonate transport system substrate-binding protein
MRLRHFALAFFAAAFVTAAAAQTALRVILFPGAQNLPMWVAEKQGFFRAEGLSVAITPTPNSVFLVKSLLKGDQDIALAAFDNVVAYQEGQGEVTLDAPPDFFAFAGITHGTVRLVAHPSIARLADLKGKVLGVDAVNTGYSLALRKILRDVGGLGEDDYTLQPIGGTGLRARALMENKTVATMLTTPFDLAAESKGYRRLANLIDVGPYQSTVAFTRGSWAATHRDTVVRFARATAKSMDWIYDPAHRGEAVAIYREQVKDSTEADARAAIESLVQEKEGFARGARLDPEGMANVLAIRSEFGKPRRDLSDVSRYVDESILIEARQ